MGHQTTSATVSQAITETLEIALVAMHERSLILYPDEVVRMKERIETLQVLLGQARRFIQGEPHVMPDEMLRAIAHGPRVMNDWDEMLYTLINGRSTDIGETIDAMTHDELRRFTKALTKRARYLSRLKDYYLKLADIYQTAIDEALTKGRVLKTATETIKEEP